MCHESWIGVQYSSSMITAKIGRLNSFSSSFDVNDFWSEESNFLIATYVIIYEV